MNDRLDAIRALLGEEVIAVLDHGKLGPDYRGRLGSRDARQVIVRGTLLGFGEGGDFEILDEHGLVHYCWPMLDIQLADSWHNRTNRLVSGHSGSPEPDAGGDMAEQTTQTTTTTTNSDTDPGVEETGPLAEPQPGPGEDGEGEAEEQE